MKPAADSRLPHWALRSEHSGAFLRLQRLVKGRSSFTLCFLTYSDSFYRDEAAAFLEGRLSAHLRVAIDPEERIGTEVLFDRLSADADGGPAQLVGLEFWREGLDDLLGRLNQRREALAERCPRPLLFWVRSRHLPLVATRAADLWAWRSGVFDFTLPPTGVRTDLHQPHLGGPVVFAAKRQERIERLQKYLGSSSSGPADVDLLLDLGDLERSLGNVAGAETAYSRALETVATLDDPRRRAITHGRIADILQERGQLDDALRILTEEQLPIFEKLGDARQQAITHARIADILQVRGQLDEALRIRTEEQLPVFEKLGDIRSRAITQSRIADILQARGQLDEALRILTEEQLPVFEELGDARSRAITQGQIADILQARGQLDDALRIRTEEQLPVFEKLGDIRSRAITQGEIADILQTRGQLDEALRILTEEQLPVFEKLGDIRSRAITQGRIADILQARGQLDDALRIRTEEQLPIFEKLGDARLRAATQGRIADILQARGQLEEALRIYEQQVLPNVEALNVSTEIDRARAKIEELRGEIG